MKSRNWSRGFFRAWIVFTVIAIPLSIVSYFVDGRNWWGAERIYAEELTQALLDSGEAPNVENLSAKQIVDHYTWGDDAIELDILQTKLVAKLGDDRAAPITAAYHERLDTHRRENLYFYIGGTTAFCVALLALGAALGWVFKGFRG